LLGTIWVVADLAQDPAGCCVLVGDGLAGGSIALLGLVQKATGAMILWDSLERGEPPVKTFFATYYHHGNAGPISTGAAGCPRPGLSLYGAASTRLPVRCG
jgi:hypothetical protein